MSHLLLSCCLDLCRVLGFLDHDCHNSIHLHQLIKRALLDDRASIHADDPVGMLQKVQLVCHQQSCLLCKSLLDASLEDVAADMGIHRTQWIVLPISHSHSHWTRATRRMAPWPHTIRMMSASLYTARAMFIRCF